MALFCLQWRKERTKKMARTMPPTTARTATMMVVVLAELLVLVSGVNKPEVGDGEAEECLVEEVEGMVAGSEIETEESKEPRQPRHSTSKGGIAIKINREGKRAVGTNERRWRKKK